MQLLALLVLVIVISIALKKKPKRSSKPKDEIRVSFARNKHYAYSLDKKIVYENGEGVKKTDAILLSSSDTDRKRANIPLKKNPNPVKVKLKKKLDRQLKQKKITKEQYEKVKNGALIPKKFTNKIACLKYDNQIVAIYQEYPKDILLAKPYKMFI